MPAKRWKSLTATPRAAARSCACKAKDCVLASWNMMIPYLCPELPAAQKAAMHRLIKTPLVYTSVALKDWQAFRKLGIRSVDCAGRLSHIVLAQQSRGYRRL